MDTTLRRYKQNMVIPPMYLLNGRYFSISKGHTQSLEGRFKFKLSISYMYRYSFSYNYQDDPNYSMISREYR